MAGLTDVSQFRAEHQRMMLEAREYDRMRAQAQLAAYASSNVSSLGAAMGGVCTAPYPVTEKPATVKKKDLSLRGELQLEVDEWLGGGYGG